MTYLETVTSQMPNIKRYTNILTYLKDYYCFRQNLSADFSYELWAAELGFKSRTFIYLTCIGKRPLTLKFINILTHHLKLNSSEKNHLLLLASYNKSKSVELKAIFFDKILESLESSESILDTKNYRKFILSPTMPLIRMILSFDDTKGTVEEISSLLDIEPGKIKKDFLELEKMGLIKKHYVETAKDIFWKSTTKAIKVPDNQTNEIMNQFNDRTLIEAQSINQQSEIFKKFRSIIFSIHPGNHDEMLTEIELFLSKMKNKYGYNEIDQKELMKINLQVYPVSKTANLN
jgi:uncharacterized protein (TIGR02147 family)